MASEFKFGSSGFKFGRSASKFNGTGPLKAHAGKHTGVPLRSAGNQQTQPSKIPTKSQSTLLGGMQLATAAVSLWGDYNTAKNQADMADAEHQHDMRMAQIELELNQFFQNAATRDLEDASAEDMMAIQIGQRQAEASVNVQSAGTGNMSAAARVRRELEASALQADSARRLELAASRRNIAATQFNQGQAFEQRARFQKAKQPSAFSSLALFGTQAVRIGQDMTKKG